MRRARFEKAKYACGTVTDMKRLLGGEGDGTFVQTSLHAVLGDMKNVDQTGTHSAMMSINPKYGATTPQKTNPLAVQAMRSIFKFSFTTSIVCLWASESCA